MRYVGDKGLPQTRKDCHKVSAALIELETSCGAINFSRPSQRACAVLGIGMQGAVGARGVHSSLLGNGCVTLPPWALRVNHHHFSVAHRRALQSEQMVTGVKS